jgi:hypothetical protein
MACLQLILLIRREIADARQFATGQLAGNYPTGQHLLLFGSQQRVRAHLPEVQIDCVSSQGQIVLVFRRDHSAGGKLNLLFDLVDLVLYGDIHLAQAREKILQYVESFLDFRERLQDFIVGDVSLRRSTL